MSVDEIVAALNALVAQITADGAEPSDTQLAEVAELERKLERAKNVEGIAKRNAERNTLVTPRIGGSAVIEAAKNWRSGGFNDYLRGIDQGGQQYRLSEGVPSEGGFLVPVDFQAELLQCIVSYGGVAAVASSITTSDGRPLQWPVVSYVTAGLDPATRAEITPESAHFDTGGDIVFSERTLGAYKFTTTGPNSLPLRVSVELLQDSAINIDGLVRDVMAERLARLEAQKWVNGTGIGEPQGILTGTADVSLVTANSFADAANGYAKLLAVESALDTHYLANARWVMSRATWANVRSMVDDNNRPLFIPEAQSSLASSINGTILGYPVTIDESFPNAANNVNFMAFGDIAAGYKIRHAGPVTVIANPWTRADYGQVEYCAWDRADGFQANRCAYVIVGGVVA